MATLSRESLCLYKACTEKLLYVFQGMLSVCDELFSLQENTNLLQAFHSAPLSAFSLQSSVMSVCFARFHPNLVVGGTYSGQIVLWDNRSHRRTPVQRTPLSAAAHTVSPALVTHLSAIQALKEGITDKRTMLSVTPS